MTERITNALAGKYNTVRKGVSHTMGGKILDHPAKRILKQGIAQGMEQGRQEGLVAGRQEGLVAGRQEERQHAAEVISQKYSIPADELMQLLNNTSADTQEKKIGL